MALNTLHKRPAPHHKKVHGAHHRHNKHYLKTYHPYLPLLILVIVGLAVNSFWAAHSRVLGARTSLTSQQLLTESNKLRLMNNHDDLILNAKLSAAAQAKANDMAVKKYWSHTSPSGTEPWKFIKQSGYEYYSAGKNLAYGFYNAEDIVAGWANSREHRANKLSGDFSEVGFGIAVANNFQGLDKATVIVALYAEPSLGLGDSGFISAASTTSQIPMRTVSRIQLLTNGQAPWSLAAMTLIALLATFWFLKRHVVAWKKVFVESEEFVIRHKFLDILIVVTAVTGFVLTRGAGFIH